ncbi:MAG: hypothetical protein ABSA81_01755 [Candidatus Bathyarchaeia archaeon]|jgi:hypothetical protein
MSGSQPKARFSSRLPTEDYLTLAVWAEKKDPTAEVLTIQIRHSAGSSWETTGRLAVYRTGDGNYSQLPERQPARETREQKAAGNISDEGNIFS